jgi:succinate dehydrogenase / fumarate reductase cytochrome b subunit
MKWSEFFTSSIGKKFIMSLTGIFLISFLVVHVGVNACIWYDGGQILFPFYGDFQVIRIVEVGLFASPVALYKVLYLNSKRSAANQYALPWEIKAQMLVSMGLLGTLLLFLIVHLGQFWGLRGLRIYHTEYNGKEVANQYAEIVRIFQNPVVDVLYVLGCLSLMYHLLQGFQSAFRTLGVPNGKHMSLIKGVGFGFSIIVSLAFAMMPLSVYLGWVS